MTCNFSFKTHYGFAKLWMSYKHPKFSWNKKKNDHCFSMIFVSTALALVDTMLSKSRPMLVPVFGATHRNQ